MISGHHFKRIGDQRRLQAAQAERNRQGLASLLSRHVVERFARLSSLAVSVRPLVPSRSGEDDDPSADPVHPACTEHRGCAYCRESWQLHLAELTRYPHTHWHKCDYGRFCAQVPVVYQERCVAALTLACPATADETEFEHQLDILDALARQFVAEQAAFLGELLHVEHVPEEVKVPPGGNADKPDRKTPTHPQVLRALQYIEEHLSDPELTVSQIAKALEIHPNYLGSLFADQVGKRMNRFITARRVDLAKTLLATTDWQVKRIAQKTGHANMAWFCHLFNTSTGFTPLGYRNRAKRSPQASR